MVTGSNIFQLIANFYGKVFSLLDKPIIYENIKFIRLVIGFIILSGCISIFWKGAKG